ncbi:pteridine-dependent deoxygenase [Vulcaniibacterium tengchongense]|uniref:Chorismate lyase/3-hydroxybenzoate synthase n=1 Tax=Vulcaniibacterium tengchongense TaxID=1273429 RepID=A0A3N4VBB3_9GAMM|nr:pteridine-dependent deoxygenase [Vulcaniibacterium tengchongense]RPE79898.1 chorismate lyase/3-hydroxybenzoate synthase [Vulcaniibacterium tengchongense]
MSAPDPLPAPAARLAVDYVHAPAAEVLAAPDTLAAIGFGDAALPDDPRCLRVALRPHGAAPLEVWRGQGPVARGRSDGVAWAEDGTLQFGAIELDEPDGDIEAAAERAYRRFAAFLRERGYPHPLRIWNYLDAITEGEGDRERYRRFCVGRARGLGAVDPAALPAATAIGRVADAAGPRRLQVYWLAARAPGRPLENPRQVSAWRYPRRYGPQPPGFARAMLPPTAAPMLLLSGTAAIVGHESRHAGAVLTQLDETLANLATLVATARGSAPALPAAFGAGARLKVYVRHAEEMPAVAAALDQRLGPQVPRILLHGAVCRRELRVEIDGVHA